MDDLSPQFDFLFNNLNQIAYIFTTPTRFGAVNKKMADYCGCRVEDLMGKSISIILNKEEFETVEKFNKNIFENGIRKTAQMEIEMDNKKRVIDVDTIPHHNQAGKVDYLLCLAEDITEKIQKEAMLFKSKKRYRSIFKQAPLAFIASDRNANIIDWNKKAKEIFGWEKEEIVGESFNLLIPEDSYAEVTEIIENVFDGKNGHNINKNIDKNGEELYCEWNTALIKDKDNKIIEIISIARDISKKIEAIEKIEFQKEELKYSELRTQFFANISHELKTPLNLIFSSLQLLEYQLKKSENNEQTKRIQSYTSSIKNNGYRLLRLVNNLIDITKIDANSFNLHRGNFDIVKLMESIVDLIDDYIDNKNRSFNFKSDLDKKIIACDPFNIERVILNLISNAVKFTAEGDEILLKIEKENDQILIFVRDTGIGIKKENQDIVFEQFRQVDQSLQKTREGSGIGLALVKSIVEMHGGKITLASIYGVYSKFNIYLPDKIIDQATIEKEKYTADNLINKLELEFSDINYI